jgi:hypothetical protein
MTVWETKFLGMAMEMFVTMIGAMRMRMMRAIMLTIHCLVADCLIRDCFVLQFLSEGHAQKNDKEGCDQYSSHYYYKLRNTKAFNH